MTCESKISPARCSVIIYLMGKCADLIYLLRVTQLVIFPRSISAMYV